MKILITGATGFVGGFLVEEALKKGHDVHITIRESSNLQYIKNLGLEKHNINLVDSESIFNHLNTYSYDTIIHNAGITKALSRQVFFDFNYASVVAFTDAINKLSTAPKFLMVSSLAACGPADHTPSGILTEHSSNKPVTYYGESKLAGENYLFDNAVFPFNIIRPTAVYGPREKDLFTMFKTINYGLNLKVGRADKKLTFIYVKDLIRAILGILESHVSRRIFLAAEERCYSEAELNHFIALALNRKTRPIILPLWVLKSVASCLDFYGCLTSNATILNNDKINEITATNWRCDISLLKEIGFAPTTDLQDGISQTARWYKAQNWL